MAEITSNVRHERMMRLKKRVMDAKTSIALDRGRIITEYYRMHENFHILPKRGGALENMFNQLPVYVREDELIVGGEGPVPGSVQIFPEYSYGTLEKEIDDLIDNRAEYNRFYISETDRAEMLEDILPYWHGKSTNELAASLIPEKAKRALDNHLIALSSGFSWGIGHTLPNYMDFVKRGVEQIIVDLETHRDALDVTISENMERMLWYNAAIQTCKGVMNWCRRHADEARHQAEMETNPVRRAELLEIARICDKVPAKPAETFHEALQALWFAHVAVRLETSAISISLGRFDVDFYPYLEKDLKNGVLTPEKAEELMECLWVKLNESNLLMPVDGTEPYVSRQAVTIGGVDANGFDVTNELTYLSIKVQGSVGMHQPSLSLRCHKNMPHRLMIEAMKVIATGGGFPALFNDDQHILGMLGRGASIEDARNYAIVGCVEASVCNKSWANCSAGKFNMPKVLMLTLHNGFDTISGIQLGPKTGDVTEFKTFEDLMSAFHKQVAYFVSLQVQAENSIEMSHELRAPVPLTSVLIEDCITRGKDVTKGGAKYNWAAPQATGQTNVGDSLAAIKRVVYEEKFVTLKELVEAMDQDFVKTPALQTKLRNAPKYGNDDDFVDILVRNAFKIFTDEVSSHKNYRGGIYHAGAFPGLSHVSFGAEMGATADGRKRGASFATGVTPQSGCDNSSITSVVNSAGKLDYFSASNGTVLTLWLHPSSMKSVREMENVVALVRRYFDLGGQEIQFNVVSPEVLKAAKENPEEYRSLVVRVTGWSSFFVGLKPKVQDEIIERTEFNC